MKPALLFLTLACILMMSACTNPMSFKTVVHEDGSLDKTLVLEKTEKGRAAQNPFGIYEGKGWEVAITRVATDTTQEKYRIEFNKHFNSVEEVNRELDNQADTLFRIYSTFEKDFRWFYTYIRYSETIRPLNRFKKISPDDFFNQEDHSFINRLPGEGKRISKADSVFLEVLNDKISDRFVTMAMLYEINEIIREVINRNHLDNKWIDVLEENQETVYHIINKNKGENNLAEKIADSLAIPLPRPKASNEFRELSRNLDSRIAFMSFSNDGKYLNEVHMPWPVVYTNADSVAGNVAVWRPLSTKFAISAYTMYAESRKMNLWAVLVSIGIVIATVALFLRKPKP